MKHYRGKTKDGDWVYGWYSESYTSSSSYNVIGPHIRHLDKDVLYESEVIPESVGQSTGIEDKHEKEVFGGDRIRPWDDDDRSLVVVWDDEGVCWGTVDWEGKKYMRLGVLDLRKVYGVIGNATDNPDLLEKP